jgi:hypothetical protein
VSAVLQRILRRVATRPSVLALSAAYVALSLALAWQGAEPRRLLLPVPHYYLFQAVILFPLFVGLVALFVGVTRGLSGEPSRAAAPEAWVDALAPAYAWPLLVAFVLPDLAVTLLLGHEHLAAAMRYYAPVAPLLVLAASVRAVRRLGAPWLRAILAPLVGLVAQALAGSFILR